MDWVDAFSDTRVIDAAIDEFGLDDGEAQEFVAQLMFAFIGNIGNIGDMAAHAAKSNPNRVVARKWRPRVLA